MRISELGFGTGLSEIEQSDYFSRLFDYANSEDTAIGKVQIMQEFYETYFGIYDHFEGEEPLASVMVHPKEQYMENGLYDSLLRSFMENKVHELTGITFKEFMKMPRYESNAILRVTGEFNGIKHKLEDKKTEKMDKEMQRQSAELAQLNRNNK